MEHLPRLRVAGATLVAQALGVVLALLFIALGATKVVAATGEDDEGEALATVDQPVLIWVGLGELLLAGLIAWRRTGFLASILGIGDMSAHVMAMLAVGKPFSAAALIVPVTLLTLVMWGRRPKVLGGHPDGEVVFFD